MFLQLFSRNRIVIYLLLHCCLFSEIYCPYQQQQHHQQQCDERRLRNCQQNILNNIQEIQTQSTITSGFQNNRQFKCSAVNRDLNCVLQLNPFCRARDSTVSSDTNNIDIILRAKSYLDNNCGIDSDWRSSLCYLRSDIRECETQFGFQSTTASTSVSCRDFQLFQNCVSNIVRYQCMSSDIDLMGAYLIDKAQQLSWSCALNTNSIYNTDTNYRSVTSSFDSGNNINRNRNIDPQVGGNQFGSNFDRLGSMNRFGSSLALNGDNRLGSSLPLNSDNRFVSSSAVSSDSCVTRANDFVSVCDEMLIQRQRDARDITRTRNNNIQLNMCCAIFSYRDCISSVVTDRCPDSSPLTVDVLMGSQRRVQSISCRDFTRDLCNRISITKPSQCLTFMFFVTFWIANHNLNSI